MAESTFDDDFGGSSDSEPEGFDVPERERGKVIPTQFDAGDWDVDSATEPRVAPDNSEVKVRIISVRIGETAKGSLYTLPTFEIIEMPDTKDFVHFLSLPDKKEMSLKQFNRSRWDLKNFGQCFGVSITGSIKPVEDWVGATGWVLLGVRTQPQYGEQNIIKEFIAT